MGGNGAKGKLNKGGGGVTKEQDKAISKIANKTRNLKKEQYRIIDENGNVVLHAKGTEHEVSIKVGDKRDLMPGAVSIHNHPDGGTLSHEDLSDFGYGARQIVAASPEGTYKLTNIKHGTKEQSSGWFAMREAMHSSGLTKDRSITKIREEAQKNPNIAKQMKAMQKTSAEYMKAKKSGKSQSTLDKLFSRYNKQSERYKTALKSEMRRVETEPYHRFYKKNAGKYGLKYEFISK